MASNGYLGEFEQMVLLAIMQGGEDANALHVRRELEENANRSVTKGAFYTTLDRLEKKKYVTWKARVPESGRRGLAQRHFRVTPQGVDELRKSRQALLKLWRGLEGLLDAT
ncbi:MAG: PadR family transcriptional regulator [Gemmatimonadetes bacterium]|nr:PadR family transcriptional regulator [Gemmatimonadota bacterium]NNF14030.1 PadR family transcriptional regulator [Gemmatimonadota bacterium]